MPLLQPILAKNLIDLMTMEEGKDITPKDWADAIGGYFQQSLFPIAGGNLAGAKSAFIATIGPKFPPSGALPLLQAAFLQFAIVASSIPGTGGPNIPPVAPLVLTPIISIGMSGAPAAVVANTMATIIDVWFRTGVYLSGTPVTPVPLPWS